MIYALALVTLSQVLTLVCVHFLRKQITALRIAIHSQHEHTIMLGVFDQLRGGEHLTATELIDKMNERKAQLN